MTSHGSNKKIIVASLEHDFFQLKEIVEVLGVFLCQDDNQLYTSGSVSELPAMIELTQECIADVKNWMTLNKLQLNPDKTEIIIISPPALAKSSSLPKSISLLGSDIPLSQSVRNLGVILDQSLSFRAHVNNVCRMCYFEIRRIASIRHLLSEETTKTLLSAFVLSRLDYCNSLLAGSPSDLIQKLQKVQNHAARLIFRSSRRDHVTPLLRSLHWLPVQNRIHYKLSLLCFQVLNAIAPQYLCDLIKVYTPSRQLRSSLDTSLFRIPSTRTKTYGGRTFFYQGPAIWNTLPLSLRCQSSSDTFKTNLKTHLFPS